MQAKLAKYHIFASWHCLCLHALSTIFCPFHFVIISTVYYIDPSLWCVLLFTCSVTRKKYDVLVLVKCLREYKRILTSPNYTFVCSLVFKPVLQFRPLLCMYNLNIWLMLLPEVPDVETPVSATGGQNCLIVRRPLYLNQNSATKSWSNSTHLIYSGKYKY